jgi:hypothetical protein
MTSLQVSKRDERAFFKMGRRYKLIDTTGTIDSLYAKNLNEVAMIKREFKNLRFEVVMLELDESEQLHFSS